VTAAPAEIAHYIRIESVIVCTKPGVEITNHDWHRPGRGLVYQLLDPLKKGLQHMLIGAMGK
jgi:hypothetical protein